MLSRSVFSDSLWPHEQKHSRLLCSGDFSDRNIEVGGHFLLQRILGTHGQNPLLLYLLHWQADSLPLSRLGSPANCPHFPPNIRNRNEAVVFFLSVSIILYIFVSLWSTIPLLSCYSCFQYFFFCQVLPRRSFWGIHLYSWVLGPRVSGFLPSYLHRTC